MGVAGAAIPLAFRALDNSRVSRCVPRPPSPSLLLHALYRLSIA
jgi:hypothetical protein